MADFKETTAFQETTKTGVKGTRQIITNSKATTRNSQLRYRQDLSDESLVCCMSCFTFYFR